MKFEFDNLPTNLQTVVKDTLRIYDRVYVLYYNGGYHVTTSVAILKAYPTDYHVVGDYTAQDIYSDNERIINYVEEFHSYPPSYKGKKDFALMRSLEWGDKVTFDKDGNIIRA